MQEIEQPIYAHEGDGPILAPLVTIHGRPVVPWLVLVSLLLGSFMASLSTTIVNIALPTIQSSLKTDLTSVSWVLHAYNLVYAVLLVTVGRFADQYGRKRLFLLGLLLLSLGSLGCALVQALQQVSNAPAISWLIGFRALQAIGAAVLTAVGLAIAIAVFPREKRGIAIGIWGALIGLAAESGPVFGGFLIHAFGWAWIFLINLPVS